MSSLPLSRTDDRVEIVPPTTGARSRSLLLISPYFEAVILGVYLLGIGILIVSALWLTGGEFAYTLDDAYIHLALAENIWQGHYGINLAEPSSPSSTVIWPLLLAPFSSWQHFELAPLLLNMMFMAAALVALAWALRAWLSPLLRPRYLFSLLFVIALSCNFWGLPLSGMEHSAQLLMTTWVAIGLVNVVKGRRVSRLFVVGLVLGPLVRFENLSLLVMGVIVLALTNQRRQAVLVLATVVLLLSAYMGLMVSEGLPIVPSSVLVKSEVISAEGFRGMLGEIGENAGEGLSKTRILPLVVMSLVLAVRIRARRHQSSPRTDTLYLLFLAGIVSAHLVAGKHGNQGRYETYLLLAGLIILIWVFRAKLLSLIHLRPKLVLPVLLLASLAVGKSQVEATLMAPLSVLSTYGVNGQMHRFVVDHWRDSVGVNDIGWVAYRNREYVLDLWGLASEPARVMRRKATDMRWAEQLAQDQGVVLFMIFESWFSDLAPFPSSWEHAASLHGPGRFPGKVSTVEFYLSDPGRSDELGRVLEAFGSRLPSGVSVEIVAPKQPSSQSM